MTWSGFVLIGGQSTRMGRDKAQLRFHGMPLALRVARVVESAAGNVTLVGRSIEPWGIPSIPDAEPGLGPLSGVVAALRASRTGWNLILACDLPRITVETLQSLMSLAEEKGKMAVVPVHAAGGYEPLCAAYHANLLPLAEAALVQRELSLQKLLGKIDLVPWIITGDSAFINTNTPEEWALAGGEID